MDVSPLIVIIFILLEVFSVFVGPLFISSALDGVERVLFIQGWTLADVQLRDVLLKLYPLPLEGLATVFKLDVAIDQF